MMIDPFNLTGKVALVTGGNGGIGLGMARGLARAGATVVVWGQNEEKNVAAREQLAALGGTAIVRKVDVSDERAVVEGIAETIETLGRLDFVGANAGIGGGGPLTLMTTEEWRRVLTVNLDAVFWTFREACKHMVQRAEAGDPGGSLLVTSSTGALMGSQYAQAYSAAKSGVLALMRGTAVEFARYGVRANAILPGWILTDMTAPLQSEAFEHREIGRVPMGRWGEPDDFAGVAVYLASEASRFHTGDSIVIDGGYAAF